MNDSVTPLPRRAAHLVPARAAAFILASVSLIASGDAPARDEIRALWVLRASLASPATIATMVRSAREHGFNTLMVQVRGRGDAYFGSTLEPRAADLAAQPDFDPLKAVLTAAHAVGLHVHAWVNVALVASAVELPSTPTHVVQRHPEWLMLPRELAQEMSLVEPTSPGYVGRLARWTRSQLAEVEGLYLSPLNAGAVSHTVAVVADLARRYAVDGVHLDYVRYPNDEFDYSLAAVTEFRADIAASVSHAQRAELDARAVDDVLAWPDAFPDRWRQFRQVRLSSLVMRLKTAVKAARLDALVTAAVRPDLQEAQERRLQDWRTWIESGLIDRLCPMVYTQDAAQFSDQIASVAEMAGAQAVWAGIGAYRLTPEQTVANIQAARRVGAAGIILFSYDSLTTSADHADYLARVSRGAFGPPVSATAGSR